MMLMIKRLMMGCILTAAASTFGAYAESPGAEPPPSAAQALSRVSINSADAETLADYLVGVGPAKAEAIVAWREANGRFENIEQLLEVKGIGPATLEKNRMNISL